MGWNDPPGGGSYIMVLALIILALTAYIATDVI